MGRTVAHGMGRSPISCACSTGASPRCWAKAANAVEEFDQTDVNLPIPMRPHGATMANTGAIAKIAIGLITPRERFRRIGVGLLRGLRSIRPRRGSCRGHRTHSPARCDVVLRIARG